MCEGDQSERAVKREQVDVDAGGASDRQSEMWRSVLRCCSERRQVESRHSLRVHRRRKLDQLSHARLPVLSAPREGLQEVMTLAFHQVFAIDRWRPRSTVITNHRSTGTLSSTFAIDLVTVFLSHRGYQGRVHAVVVADIVSECR